MSDSSAESKEQDDVLPEEKLDALNRVRSSAEFEGADRLKDFLAYVVHEDLAGRGDTILGKVIAQDVYGRRAQDDAATANVVRVDAGRLRRRLESYYLDGGSSDPVRIQIDKGGYAPRFLRTAKRTQKVEATPQLTTKWMILGAATVIPFVLLLFFVVFRTNDTAGQEEIASDQREQTERTVLFDTAPLALQARNLAKEARSMMFPATQPNRLLAAQTLFQEVIALDPLYYGGYAGAAQTSGMIAGLAPLGPQRDEMLMNARRYAEKAVELDPAMAWSQSALAFVSMFERNYDEANRLSGVAVSLAPDELDILEIDAIIAFFSGDFERAQTSVSPELHRRREGLRFPWRSILGNSAYHLGRYDEAIKNLLDAAAYGEPVSEITTAHLIAALQSSGRGAEAKERVRELEKAWPESRLEEILLRLFDDPQNARNVLERLREAGWQQ